MTSSHVAIILTHGFALVAGLIIAIGPQNLFLLRQGVQRRHLFLVATTCTLCDLLLLTLGLGGLHRFLLAYPALFRWVSWAGIFFLVYSGARAFHAAFTPAVWTDAPTLAHPPSVRSTLGATLVVSLLNPSAYLEMVLLIGSVGSRYPLADRLVFGTGALCASTFWFFGLAYGAAWLAPWFRRAAAGRLLDLLSGTTLWLMAGALW